MTEIFDEFIPEPVTHYEASRLNLSLIDHVSESSPYTVAATSTPPDYNLLAGMSALVRTGDAVSFTGGEDPRIECVATTIEAAVKIALALSKSALSLTQADYPSLTLQLDTSLSVFAQDILLNAASDIPQPPLF